MALIVRTFGADVADSRSCRYPLWVELYLER